MRSWGHFSCRRFDDLVADERAASNSKKGSHLSARAQERIMTDCRVDAKVELLGTAFVALALFRGRQVGLPPMTQERVPVPRASRRSLFVHGGGVPLESWESLDGVDLADIFLRRVPMLQSCPHFFRGRLRFCFSMGTNQSQTCRIRATTRESHRQDEFAPRHWDSLLRVARQNLFNKFQHRELTRGENSYRDGYIVGLSKARCREPGRL